VLAEVVAQVAAFAKDRIAASKLALEIKFDALRVLIVHLYRAVPLDGDPIKVFLLSQAAHCDALDHSVLAIVMLARMRGYFVASLVAIHPSVRHGL